MQRNELCRARPAARRLLRAVTEAGYTTPTPIQAQAIPVDPRRHATSWAAPRPAPARPPASRCRSCRGCPARQLQPVARAPSGARADPHADARARDPGRGSDQGLRQVHRTCARPSSSAASTSSSSWRSCAPGVEILVATPGPPARPHRAQERLPRRRSRSSSSTRPTACSTWASSPTSSGSWRCCRPRRSGRTCSFSATFSGEIKKLADQLLNAPQLIEVAAQHGRRNRDPERLQGARRTPSARCSTHIVQLAQPLAGAVLRAHQARRVAARAPAREGRPRSRRRSTATRRRGARSRRSTAFKEGKLAGAGRHRRRRPRPRHRRPAAGRQLRAAARARGLHPPHRPHRPRRRLGRGDLVRRSRRGEATSSEIERLLKKKVPITVAEGFDPVAGSRREHGERGDRGIAARGTPGRPTSRGRRARIAPRATRRVPNARRAAKRGPSGRRARTRASSASAPTNSTPTSRCRWRATTRAVPRSAGLGPRAGFGQGRPVPALLMKRPAVPAEPEGG